MNIEIKAHSVRLQEAGLIVQNLDGDSDLTVTATYEENLSGHVEGIAAHLNWQQATALYNVLATYLNSGEES